MLKYDALIFDFDGTVADTAPGVIESIRHALSQVGVEADETENMKRFVGPPIRNTFENNFGLKGEKLETAMSEFRIFYDNEGAFLSNLFAGMEELFTGLKSLGIDIAIASTKNEASLNKIIEYYGIKDVFKAIVGVGDPMNATTKTQNILKAVRLMGANPERTLMVGDRYFDAAGAEE
ncbi:MAG: HAD hydrolase-like protein, partial [Ruminococcaceae bacterium]|nr:HAD hydrolase-like protein [Oscillospiraceae bacterium]